MTGPLQGLKVVEFAGIGPGPFCAMMLADMGAEVLRIEQKARVKDRGGVDLVSHPRFDVLARGRRSLALDLKKPGAVEIALKLISRADALIEGFRPGVMERLGLGPETVHHIHPRLTYGRMTGWGQFGPMAPAAGHDINYIALSGALSAIGEHHGHPCPPLNLLGDFGGGAMMLAFGLLCGIIEARSSGKGQVVDAAITDGTSLLAAPIYGLFAAKTWNTSRASNLLDGGAHFYGVYVCADGRYISIGSIEPQFYALLLRLCDIQDAEFQQQMDQDRWKGLREKLQAVFLKRTRDQWCLLLEGTDVCFAPVLTWEEAPHHPHNRARGTFVEVDGVTQPAPAPRFSRTAPTITHGPVARGDNTMDILLEHGVSYEDLERLQKAEAI